MTDHREAWPTAILTGGALDGIAVNVDSAQTTITMRSIYQASKSGAGPHPLEGQAAMEFHYVKTDKVDTEGRRIFVVATSS